MPRWSATRVPSSWTSARSPPSQSRVRNNRGPGYRSGGEGVLDQQLDVAVLHSALAARVGRALAGAHLGVVVTEGAPDRGQLERVGAREAGDGGRGRGVARVVEDGAEDRKRAVVIVEDLNQPALLGPVGLGGGADHPEATAVAVRIGHDIVDVTVPGDPGDRVRMLVQQRGEVGAEVDRL